MKSKFILCCLLLCTAFSASGARAQDPLLLLDVQVQNGRLQDLSSQARTIKQGKLQPAENGEALLVSKGSVKIFHNPEDPLFQAGARTWMMRFKIQKSPGEGYYPIAGQWLPASNNRLIAFILKGGAGGQVSFHVSPSGGVQDQSTAILKDLALDDRWITLVGIYRPGTELALTAYDDKRNLLGRVKVNREIPAAHASAAVDFEFGGPSGSGFQMSALKVWSGALGQAKLLENLPALSGK